jgi:hypothetical protein
MRVFAFVFFPAIAIMAAVAQESPPRKEGSGQSNPPPAAQAEGQPATPSERIPAAKLGVIVYPKKDQTAEQQQQDETQCYDWAYQNTGIDPAHPEAGVQKAEAKNPKGGGAKGAAGGAAGGAAIGAIAGDAGTGAAIGATAGAVHGRRQQKKAKKQSAQAAQTADKQAVDQQLTTFKKAMSACLDGRDYSVK